MLGRMSRADIVAAGTWFLSEGKMVTFPLSCILFRSFGERARTPQFPQLVLD